MKRIFEIDPWKIITHNFDPENKRLQESMTRAQLLWRTDETDERKHQ